MKRAKASVGEALVTIESEGTIGEGTDERSGLFRDELIYLGQDGNAFFLAYRQSFDGRMREPFSLRLTYRLLNPETDIEFRGIAIKVLSATNQRIEADVSETASIEHEGSPEGLSDHEGRETS